MKGNSFFNASKFKSKLLVILMSVIMVTTYMPALAFAAVVEGDVAKIGDGDQAVGYKTLAEAIEKATDGQTVKMIGKSNEVSISKSGETTTYMTLADFRDEVNSGTTYYGYTVTLLKDIDLKNEPWTPIGIYNNSDYSKAFQGTFDGDNHTISNLTVSNSTRAGLFGFTAGNDSAHVYIKNLTINNANISGTGDCGAVVGRHHGYIEISNVHVTGTVKVQGPNNANVGAAGILGWNDGGCKIENCSVEANANSDSYIKVRTDKTAAAGGIVGHLSADVSDDCYVTNCQVKNIDLTAFSRVGGIVGTIQKNDSYTNKKYVSNCSVENVNVTVHGGGSATDTMSERFSAQAGLIVGCTAGSGTKHNRYLNVYSNNTYSGDCSVTSVVGATDVIKTALYGLWTLGYSRANDIGQTWSTPEGGDAVVTYASAQETGEVLFDGTYYKTFLSAYHANGAGKTGSSADKPFKLMTDVGYSLVVGDKIYVEGDGHIFYPRTDVEGYKVKTKKISDSVKLYELVGKYVAQIGTAKYETLADALIAAENGDTVEILGGTWDADAIGTLTTAEANVVRYKSLTIQPVEAADVTFTSDVKLGYDDSSTANATMTIKNLKFNGASLSIGNYVNVSVEDCTFKDSTNTAGALIIRDACSTNHKTEGSYPNSSVTVRNCTIDGSAAGAPGIRLRDDGNVTLTNNTIKNTNHNGILFEKNKLDTSKALSVTVTGNKVTDWNVNNVNDGGRAIRASLETLASGSTVTIKDNIFRKETLGKDSPDFIKITGATNATVDLNHNDWNFQPLSEVSGKTDYYTVDGSAPALESVIGPIAQVLDTDGTTVVKRYANLQTAVNEATEGQTVQMLEDVKLTAKSATEKYGVLFPAGKKITFDLNGKKLEGGTGFADSYFLIRTLADELTLKDSSEGKTGTISFNASATSIWYGSSAISVYGGKTIVESGTYINSPTNGGAAYVFDVSNNEHAAELVINGGSFSCPYGDAVIRMTLQGWVSTQDADTSKLTINDGTFTGGAGESVIWVDVETTKNYNPKCDIIINGGTFTAAEGKAVFDIGSGTNRTTDKLTITVNGGQFKSSADYIFGYRGGFTDALISGIDVKGGIFSTDKCNNIPNKNGQVTKLKLADLVRTEGKTVVANTDDTTKADYPWTIGNKTYVAQIGETKYETLAAAITDVKGGETIELLKDLTDIGRVSLPANVTLDGNGHQIITGNSSIYISKDGGTIKNVVFQGIGNEKATLSAIYAESLTGKMAVDNCRFVQWDWDAIQVTPKEGAEIKITNNYFKKQTDVNSRCCVHIQAKSSEKPIIKADVSNNTFITNDIVSPVAIWYANYDSELDLSNNYFDVKHLNIALYKEDKLLTDRCDEAFPSKATKDAETATEYPVAKIPYAYGAVYYMTLSDAIKAAETDDTIILLKDFDITKQVNIDKKITLDGAGHTITRTSGGDLSALKAGILVTANATIKDLTVSGPNGTNPGWDKGEFGIKLYDTEATLNNITVKDANAGIQVNKGNVKMTGTINVSGNEFGGIEVCHEANLDLTEATLKCTDESETKPVLWNDDTKGTITQNPAQPLWSKEIDDGKDHYYLSVAKIGNVYYPTLAAAIAAVPTDGTQKTITMLCDVNNATGISVPSGKNFIVDFANHTYTINHPGAGSTGTSTQGFQLLKNSTIEFRNGTINVAAENKDYTWTGDPRGIAWVINNYANLTLTNMTVDGTNVAKNLKSKGGLSDPGIIRYVINSNTDIVTVNGGSIIAATGDVAISSNWYGSAYPTHPTVSITGSTITGKVEAIAGTVNLESGTTVNGQVRVGENKSGSETDAVVNIKAGATVQKDEYPVVVFGKNQLNVSGTVKSTSNTSTDTAAIATNGNAYNAGSEINVYDGAVVEAAKCNGIYMPNGQLNIFGGTISGDTAVYFKSTGLNITGGSLIGNGVKTNYNYNGNGGNSTGDALVIDSCNYPSGLKSEDVKVSGGLFSSTNGKAVAAYTSQDATPVTRFVSGGYFTQEVNADYIAPGYECVVNPDYNVTGKDTKDYQYKVQTKIVIPIDDDDPSAGKIDVQVEEQAEQKDATVSANIPSGAAKAAADEIAGKINGSGEGQNKSKVVDLTETVGNYVNNLDMNKVKALAKEMDQKHEITEESAKKETQLNALLTNAKTAAKIQGKDVEVTMTVTTDVDVAVTKVTVDTQDTAKITTFALDITPYYTLTVVSQIKGGEAPATEKVQIVTETMKEELKVPETTVVTFPAPERFVYTEGMGLFVNHTKENGDKYTYPATYDAATKMVSFNNPHGFSEFELVTTTVADPVAKNIQTGKFYTDLTTALSEAENNQTVILLKDLTDDTLKQNLVEVAPNVTLDLNGYDLKARIVMAFGLVKNNRGSADGKLIVAKDNFAYFGGKEKAASNENVMPVWDTNGYIFCALNMISDKWDPELSAGKNPRYKFRPESADIAKILAENSGVKVLVEIEYKRTNEDDYDKMTVEFGQQYITEFLNHYNENWGMYVTLLGTNNISEIKARVNLKSDKSNFSIVSGWNVTPASN